jgi:cytochrome P450
MSEVLIVGSDDPVESTAELRRAAALADTAVTELGMVCVLRYAEVERLLHDHRLEGIGLSMFDLIGVPDGPLRDWYSGLMFTNEGPGHHRLRRLVGKAFTSSAAI